MNVIVEDGTRITYIPNVMWERVPIVKAFAIGDEAVTGDEVDVFDDERRAVKNWGRIFERHEGILWCRGWDGQAADALRAAAALACPPNQILYEHKGRLR